MAAMDVKGKIRLALGSLKDQAAIGKAVIAGQNSVSSEMDVAILRCTDRAAAPVDDKYVHELLFLACNSPGSVSLLAGKISRRLETARDGVVALKTLVLLHRLLRGGDRRFELGVCNLHAAAELRLDLGRLVPSDSFLRRYASFLEERMRWRINSFGGLEPVQPSGDVAAVVLCQAMLDRVIDCSPARNVVTGSDPLTLSALAIVLRESFRVYESFCEKFMALRVSPQVRWIAEKAALQTAKLRDFYDECKWIAPGKNIEYPRVRIISAGDLIAASDGGGVSGTLEAAPLLSRRLETKIRTRWVAFDE